MTTKFILIRHGETNWNREGRYQGQIDTALSDYGRNQGAKITTALESVPIDVCYSSPLKRSYDTAKMGLGERDITINTDDRLLEINHGAWEGLLASEVEKRWPDILEKWRTTVVDAQMPGGGENIVDVKNRAMEAFEEYAREHEGKTILVAAHDAINKAVLCAILDIDLSKFWQVKQDNTCINVFEYENGKWRLVLMNSTAHLGFLFSGIEQAGL